MRVEEQFHFAYSSEPDMDASKPSAFRGSFFRDNGTILARGLRPCTMMASSPCRMRQFLAQSKDLVK